MGGGTCLSANRVNCGDRQAGQPALRLPGLPAYRRIHYRSAFVGVLLLAALVLGGCMGNGRRSYYPDDRGWGYDRGDRYGDRDRRHDFSDDRKRNHDKDERYGDRDKRHDSSDDHKGSHEGKESLGGRDRDKHPDSSWDRKGSHDKGDRHEDNGKQR